MSDAGSYECLVKPYDGAAVAAIVNLTVYGKRLLLLAIDTQRGLIIIIITLYSNMIRVS